MLLNADEGLAVIRSQSLGGASASGAPGAYAQPKDPPAPGLLSHEGPREHGTPHEKVCRPLACWRCAMAGAVGREGCGPLAAGAAQGSAALRGFGPIFCSTERTYIILQSTVIHSSDTLFFLFFFFPVWNGTYAYVPFLVPMLYFSL